MTSYIEIGNYIFRNQVNAVGIKTGRKHFGDKATIKLPNIKGLLEKTIKTNDPVLIKLGYDGENFQEFTGYVSEVSPKIPLEISCEDEMYQLRRQEIKSASWESISLKKLIDYIVPGANINCHDITLSPFRIDNDVRSRAEALQKIKDEFGLDVYYRGNQLYVGLAYQEKVGEVNFHFQKNAIMGDLFFKRKEDLRLRIKAISFDRNNKKTQVEVGDKNGEIHTLHFYNKSAAELKKLALEKINLMKYDGYRGSFKSKGVPRATHGMIANLDDDKYPERKGSYFIDEIESTYNSSDGFSRKITLGRKASELLIQQ